MRSQLETRINQRVQEVLEKRLNEIGECNLKSFEYVDSLETGWGWSFILENGKTGKYLITKGFSMD